MPIEITENEKNALLEKCRDVLGNDFYPEGGTSVSAAVLTEDSNIHLGVNLKSVISGMGTCAERNAIGNAVTNGDYQFKAICIMRDSKTGFKPCGMCLQLMNEFAQLNEENDLIIFMAGTEEVEQTTLRELLPELYGPADKNLDLSEYKQ